MKKVGLIIICGLLLIGFSALAQAHVLWINLYESYTHPPGHAMVSIGWGHTVPLDDFLKTEFGKMELDSFALYDPDLNKQEIPQPDASVWKKEEKSLSGMKICVGDVYARRLTLTENTKPGTYQVAAVGKKMFFTMYLDKNGKKRAVPKPMNEFKEAKKILASVYYQSWAKAFTAVSKWTEPKPLGFKLELTPMTDLSKVHVGDLVPIKVTFMGRPLSCGGDTIYTMNATSPAFGNPDWFHLSSYIINGKAQFRVPAAGQWVVWVYVKQDVSPEKGPKELVGKCTSIYFASSLSFNAKP